MTYRLVGNCGKSSQDSYVLFLQLPDSNYFKRKVKSKQNPKNTPKTQTHKPNHLYSDHFHTYQGL